MLQVQKLQSDWRSEGNEVSAESASDFYGEICAAEIT